VCSGGNRGSIWKVREYVLSCSSSSRLIGFGRSALQGHANKSKGLLTASGAISLKGPEQYDELQADIQAVSSKSPLQGNQKLT
jgi:hypothetical protein